VEPALTHLPNATASGFSHDSSQVIYRGPNLNTLLMPTVGGNAYLEMEGGIIYYDSHYGRVLKVNEDGLLYRDLRKAVRQLDELGLEWEGPAFAETPSSQLQKVELSPELAGLKGYSQWMDYLDEQALNDAELHSDDGHLLFQAARVEIERCNYVEALALLERCSHLLPDALTPIQWQAYVLAELQRWPDAIAAATRFIDATDDVELRLQRAAWCLEVGLPHQAIEDAKAVIENNHFLTRRAQAIKLLAYRQLGDFDAIPTIQAEIEKNRPHDRRYAEAVDAMTIAEISLRHSRLAEVYAEQLLELNNPEYRVPLAWMNIRRGDFETALALIEHSDAQPTVPDDSPDFACSVALKVICHSNLGNWQKAGEQAVMLDSLKPASCTGAWNTQARRTRLIIAEANKVFELKRMPLDDPAKAQK